MPLFSSPAIPPELWRQIFFDAAAAQRRDLPFASSIDTSLFPWVPARVSREWRAILLAEWCLELWAEVRVDQEFANRFLPQDNYGNDEGYSEEEARVLRQMMRIRRKNRPMKSEKTRELVSRLQTQLQYAGDSPPSITLDIDDPRIQAIIMSTLWPLRSTWKVFKAEQTAWSSFEDVEASTWDDTFERFCTKLTGSTEVHFPNLVSVGLSYSSKRSTSVHGFAVSYPNFLVELFQPRRVPVLTEAHIDAHLTLFSVDAEHFSWNQLQVLSIDNLPRSYLGILFPRIPHLRELRLQMQVPTLEHDPVEGMEQLEAASLPACTTFPNLTKFQGNAMSVLPLIHAPALRSLSFKERIDAEESQDNPSDSPPPLALLLEFIQRSGCSLVDLTLQDVSSPTTDPPQKLTAILQASSALHHLELTDMHPELVAAIAVALSPSPNDTLGACPHLTHLVVEGTEGNMDAVVKMVETRATVDQRLVEQGECSRLSSVIVKGIGEDGLGFVQRFSGSTGVWSSSSE